MEKLRYDNEFNTNYDDYSCMGCFVDEQGILCEDGAMGICPYYIECRELNKESR